ncbi:MAG: hybrid sensor histidine kinase/response regulator [Candidatus Omnitrophica bacterium]|nr:hybrid sensor histidine kinase/response regulator [Candidatus Omnitrophota bacterium]MDE2009255.1 hybrid sensor histidine kinase/response regulator [Candidatus Omnitrophota bacterium]MDE2213775.1 hybrid sensor histidine kinase/response regulator [Candidatus Omnitrophota bacterium]MDE2230649.1 hybrid sensor histidine kinase/response regulator [Candidatus Omnitrophota bacterium]
MPKETLVIFLDDEQSIIDGIQRLFIREPYGVFATTNVNEAREALAKEKIKVVVSDYRMPDVSGVKFLGEVKEKYPDAVKILFTGYTDFSAAEEAINVGEVYRFISKPWKTTELLHTIRQCIEHYDLVLDAKTKTAELEISNKKLKAMYEVQKEFTSTVSHELRTPLASIKTGVDLVLRKMVGELNSQQQDILGRVKSEVDRLKRLINDILDLTKMESGKLQMSFMPNNVNNVIKQTVDSQKDVAQAKGLYLKMELDDKLPMVPFDNDRLIQVMNNLLSNAIKFTKEGGITVLSLDKSPNNHIQVCVKDTGKGIAEADFSKLFGKFQQIESAEKNEEGGTGLGLAICREIIERHGGKIWAESKLGEGTSFIFILPIQERREIKP